MTNFLIGILELTVGMSLMIALALLFFRLFGKRFTARCRYIIWAIVLARLAIPFAGGFLPALIEIPIESQGAQIETPQDEFNLPTTLAEDVKIPETPAGNNSYTTVKPVGNDTYTPTLPTESTLPPSDSQDVQDAMQAPDITSEYPEAEAPTQSAVEEAPTVSAVAVIAAVYFTGVVAFLAWNLTSYFIYTRRILRNAYSTTPAWNEILINLCKNKGVRSVPEFFVAKEIYSPIAFGLFRRKIVLPDIEFSVNGIVGTLAHEVTHCKRGDLQIKFMILFARAVNWFNPLVHLAARRCETAMELSCDEAVLAGMSEEVRRSYGNVMLDIVERCSRKRSLLTTHFNPHKNAVKERIMNILDMTKKSRGRVIIAVTLLLCVITGTIIGCSVKDEKTKEKDTPSPNESDVNIESEMDDTIPADKDSGYYLSITGTYQENSVYSEVYATYEIDLDKYTEHLKLPSTAAYPCSVCDLVDGKVYYSAAEESVINDKLVMIDNIYVYDILSGEHKMLTTDGFFAGKMIKYGDRLYVMGSPLSTVGSYFGWINLSSGEMIFPDLFETSGYTNFNDIAYSFQTNEMYLTWYDGKEQNRLNAEGGENRELAPSMLDVMDMVTYEKKHLKSFPILGLN